MKEATKHTSGPWHIIPYGDGDSLVICSDEAGDQRVAFMATGITRQSKARIKADAHLIASAPDLVDALEPFSRALDDFRSYLTDEEWQSIDPETHLVGNGLSVADLLRARSALARARGETP
jgi:hypothetical protein